LAAQEKKVGARKAAQSWAECRRMALTAKQAAFVAEYLIDLNASQAALRAGYKPSTAASTGNENLQKPEIQQAVQEAMQKRAARTEITQDKVLSDVEKIKINAMRTRVGKDGAEEMINHTAALKACELQGRHLKMWSDKLDITASVSIADAIRKRIAQRSASNG
jgi:phage terminase small subunit